VPKETIVHRKEQQEYLCYKSADYFINRCTFRPATKPKKPQVAAVDTKESLAPKKTRKRKKTKNKLAREVVGSNTESLTKLSDLGNK
jgi:hypothetical protein